MIPHRTPALLPWLYPSLVWRVETDERKLFLTFDDGPVPGPTEYVLETLAAAGLRGTFFCIGDNIRKYPSIFSRLLADGHLVGNHTVNHLNGWTTRTAEYLSNVREFDGVVAAAGLPGKVKLFRPPYGRILKKQIAALRDLRIIMWDVLSRDYSRNLDPERCLRGTISACRPGSIVVLHDSYKAQRNLEYVLPRLIDHFGSKQFSFETISTGTS